jgi:hypothetical protein
MLATSGLYEILADSPRGIDSRIRGDGGCGIPALY